MFVQACEKIGCHVVLDDFTLHHNSMRWLGSSALKFLKLDPKITAVAMKDRVPQALVVAIAQASKVLGLSCVAKRVDTPAVRDWLSAVGLDYAQGFLLDQPRALVPRAQPPNNLAGEITTRRARRAPGRLLVAARSSYLCRMAGLGPLLKNRASLFWMLHVGGWLAYALSQFSAR